MKKWHELLEEKFIRPLMKKLNELNLEYVNREFPKEKE
jgi:hypothetical protein